MRIAVSSDHAGFEQKQEIVAYLGELGHEVTDLGPHSDDRVDYPDYARAVAEAVTSGEVDRGVLVCGTGIGMSMAANKIPGIRAANVVSPLFAELSREHNDANVIAVSGRFVDLAVNEEIVRVFLETPFGGGRHSGRVEKIMKLDHDC